MKLWLVGMMGAGKSTVGRRVADQVGVTFGDMDAELEARYGPIETQFADEEAFRERERALVEEWARVDDPVVVACGGGAVIRPDARAAMRSTGLVVWLEAPTSILASRADPTGRPLLADAAPVGVLAALEAERESAYRAAAHVVLDASQPVEHVVEKVIGAWRR